MTQSRLLRAIGCLSLLCMAHISLDALAQEFPPKKTITIVVGFAPGGSADSAARVIADRKSTRLNSSHT